MTIRQIRIEGELAFIPLTQGYEAVIDVADLHLVEGKNWCADVKRKDGKTYTVYAMRGGPNCRVIYMHREIAAPSPDMKVDHKDGNGLNNRRLNLRQATTAQNAHNSRISRKNVTGFKGVSLDRTRGKYQAHISILRKKHNLGLFDNIEDAAAAYAAASAKFHGEFGRTE